MSRVYIVVLENRKTLSRAVSSEGYTTLEQAQEFCQRRTGVTKVTPCDFESETYRYWITDITIKEV